MSATYAGVAAVDPAAVDAARGMGKRPLDILFDVELPCALPLIFSGLRSATLQIISTATIAAYVSLGGLGRLIIDGRAQNDYYQMAAGAVLVGALAADGRSGHRHHIEADGLTRTNSPGIGRHQPKLHFHSEDVDTKGVACMAFNILKAAGAFALIALSATTTLAQTDPLGNAPAQRSDTSTIIVGSADFPKASFWPPSMPRPWPQRASRRKPSSASAAAKSICRHFSTARSICCQEYAGATLSYLDKNATAHSPRTSLQALKKALPEGVVMLTPSVAQDFRWRGGNPCHCGEIQAEDDRRSQACRIRTGAWWPPSGRPARKVSLV